MRQVFSATGETANQEATGSSAVTVPQRLTSASGATRKASDVVRMMISSGNAP